MQIFIYISDKKTLIWPNTTEISPKSPHPPSRCFFSCSLTALSISSLQLFWCWVYFGHLLPVLPDFPMGSEKTEQFSWLALSLLYYTFVSLLHWGLYPKTSTNISFSVLIFLHVRSIKMHDCMNFHHENRTHII